MRIIKCPGLTLEPQTAAHAERMFVVLSDPAIYEFENEPPQSEVWLCARFTRLELRRSSDGQEQWLNWVIRLPTTELIGYVQATVRSDGTALIAYVLASAYWGRGLARLAVEAMIGELACHYQVRTILAVFKHVNQRSARLLERLGFQLVPPAVGERVQTQPDELLMQIEVRDL